jgi:site-specific recombinase XerD
MPCTLEYTDERFVFASKSYPNIPLLVDGDFHFVQPVCSYLTDLIIKKNLAATSVKTYAQYIQSFWNHLEKKGIAYYEVTDRNLLEWLNTMELRGTKSYVRAQRCDTVFDLYCWLEVHGHVEDCISVPGHNDKSTFSPMLTSKRSKASRYGISRYGIVSAIRPATKDKDSPQFTPDAKDMTHIYVAADSALDVGLIERNHLMIDWAADAGLRRMEFLSLTVQQIPTWDVIDELRRNNHVFELRLVATKGGRPRVIQIIPRLLEKTREYIEGPRATVVARFKKKYPIDYSSTDRIFLSSKTGMGVSLGCLSNLFRGYFKAANVPGHGHRIRAYHLQKLLEAEVTAAVVALLENGLSPRDIDWEKIMRTTAERAGHRDLASISKYVTPLKKRWAREAGRDDYVSIMQQLTALKQELSISEHRLLEMKAMLKR